MNYSRAPQMRRGASGFGANESAGQTEVQRNRTQIRKTKGVKIRGTAYSPRASQQNEIGLLPSSALLNREAEIICN
ncbi:MAG: hypothetical protein CRN43_06525 [Candidatus Nephrothrix sp. EaCA]|nr:MAG: hypothetical protein CRN43_06525 [Candidatus Nephrothrix sp. EaCA]